MGIPSRLKDHALPFGSRLSGAACALVLALLAGCGPADVASDQALDPLGKTVQASCTPGFRQVNVNGFGNINNLYAWSMEGFNG